MKNIQIEIDVNVDRNKFEIEVNGYRMRLQHAMSSHADGIHMEQTLGEDWTVWAWTMSDAVGHAVSYFVESEINHAE